jgi:hypothetical protein
MTKQRISLQWYTDEWIDGKQTQRESAALALNAQRECKPFPMAIVPYDDMKQAECVWNWLYREYGINVTMVMHVSN